MAIARAGARSSLGRVVGLKYGFGIMNVNKIVKYGLQDLVKSLKNEGKSDTEIARIISLQYGDKYPELKNLSRMSIARFFEALARDEVQEKLNAGKTEDEIIEEIYNEFRQKMRAIIQKMEERDKIIDELLEEAKRKGETKEILEYLREQRQNIEQLRKNLVSLVQYAERQFKPVIQIDMHKEIKVKNLLLSFSKELCSECRKKVAKKILEVE